ncbi:MAG: hemerythrin domain-containing protein [Chloroflexota bacterium]|nr:hemerythrin domain-containing protein [Chloroflexota bacterium]
MAKTDTATDVLKFLEDEHDEAKAVFKKLEKAEGATAAGLWTLLKDVLSGHEEREETLFYPSLKKEPAAKDLILEAYQEHHVMDLLIEEISHLEPSDEVWAPKIKVLQENTEHHIEEEEGELFPKVRKIWDAARREQVGRQMQEAKANRQQRQQVA